MGRGSDDSFFFFFFHGLIKVEGIKDGYPSVSAPDEKEWREIIPRLRLTRNGCATGVSGSIVAPPLFVSITRF